MRLSYAITVADEFEEIQKLLKLLLQTVGTTDEIVVLVDLSKHVSEVSKVPYSPLLNYLYKLASTDKITLVEDYFKGDFSMWKNSLNSYCKGDYIFQLDADELPSDSLLHSLNTLISFNLELYYFPRENRVEGLTQQDIVNWNWNVDNKGRVNYPDIQGRLYKNKSGIKWEGKVHERVKGYQTYTVLTNQESLHLIHNKSIERQRSQNNYYNTLIA
jgi:hypothetical protein